MAQIKIVIAEDHAYFRKSIVRDLCDYHIVTLGEAANGRELMQLLEKTMPDVLLLDLNMPVMDGNHAYAEIKNRYSRLKVIVLSQHDHAGVMDNYIARGVQGYLPKQFISNDVAVLAKGIAEVQGGNTFFYAYDSSNVNEKYTRREVDVIPLLLKGNTTKEIGTSLGLAVKTVEAVRSSLFKKTNSRNLGEFVSSSIKKGLEFLGKN